MTDFKAGDRIRVTSLTNAGPSIYLSMEGTIAEGPHPETGRFRLEGDGIGYWVSPQDMTLLEEKEEEEEEEKMIPASKVREVARRYAIEHGWCSVVDRALVEMGATDDPLVEVTYTATRTVTLRRSDLNRLNSTEDMTRLYSGIDGQVFRGQNVPEGATLADNRWTRSEPRNVSDAGWISFGPPGPLPAVGTRVRVRPGVTAVSLQRITAPGGTEGTIVRGTGASPGRIHVQFMGDAIRQYLIEDLQVHPRR